MTKFSDWWDKVKASNNLVLSRHSMGSANYELNAPTKCMCGWCFRGLVGDPTEVDAIGGYNFNWELHRESQLKIIQSNMFNNLKDGKKEEIPTLPVTFDITPSTKRFLRTADGVIPIPNEEELCQCSDCLSNKVSDLNTSGVTMGIHRRTQKLIRETKELKRNNPSLETGEVRTVSSTGAEKGMKPQRFDLIPIDPLTLLAELYGEGAKKYSEHNWRAGYEWSKSYAAALRHLTQFWNGEDIDEETGKPHVICVIFHMMTLAQFMKDHPEFDDRYKDKVIELNTITPFFVKDPTAHILKKMKENGI